MSIQNDAPTPRRRLKQSRFRCIAVAMLIALSFQAAPAREDSSRADEKRSTAIFHILTAAQKAFDIARNSIHGATLRLDKSDVRAASGLFIAVVDELRTAMRGSRELTKTDKEFIEKRLRRLQQRMERFVDDIETNGDSETDTVQITIPLH